MSETAKLAGKEILLCVTGGIACYKAADLASKLVQSGAGVNVAMSDNASKFVAPLTFGALTRRQVYTSLWMSSTDFNPQHISLTEKADIMVVAPATANIIAKMAAGISDDLIASLFLSSTGQCPVLVAPAMNSRMYAAPATQRNIETLKSWGVNIIGPAEGNLACGTTGPGRMVEPGEIVAGVEKILK